MLKKNAYLRPIQTENIMNSNQITKPTPAKFGSKLSTFLIESAKFLGGMTHGTANQVQHAIIRMKNLLRFVVASIAIMSVLVISNIFVLNLADAQGVTSVTWSGTTATTIHETSNTPAASQPNNAKITTDHSTLSELSFKSKLFDESSTPVEADLTTSQSILVTGWTGEELSAEVIKGTTSYGHWVVGNLDSTTCAGGTHCYDVRFIPNATNINNVIGKAIKIELDVLLTPSGQTTPTETDTISYVLNADSIGFSLVPGNSRHILASSGTTVLKDVNLRAIFTYSDTNNVINLVSATETTSNAASPTTPGHVVRNYGTPTNTPGFSSELYVENLSLGSWYIADSNISSSVNQFDNNLQTIARRVLFRPKISAITALPPNSIRTAKITINFSRSGHTIRTATYSVRIETTDKPTLSISAVTPVVAEGDPAQIKVTTTLNPGTDPISLKYTPTETGSDYLDVTAGASGTSRTINLNFTKTANIDEWTEVFNLDTRAADGSVADNGTISVVLDPTLPPLANLTYLASITPVTITVNNIDQPAVEETAEIPEISIEAPNRSSLGNHQPGDNLMFNLTSSVRSAQDITIRYKPSTTAVNLLDTTIGLSGRPRKQTVSFNASGTGKLAIPTLNSGTRTGSIMVELVNEDNRLGATYTVSDSNHTASADIYDHSVTVKMGGSTTRTIEISDTSATYPHIPAEITVINSEKGRYNRQVVVSKSEDGGAFNHVVTVPDPNERYITENFPQGLVVTHGTIPFIQQDYITEFGKWRLPQVSAPQGTDRTAIVSRSNGVQFEPNSVAINDPNKIPPGTVIKLELRLRLNGSGDNAQELKFEGITSITTIYIQHKDLSNLGSGSWDSNSETSISESRTSSDINTNKEATIMSKYDTLSALSFKSKHDDDIASSNPTEIALIQEEEVAEWSGLEWTALTPYGRWIVGNRRTCETLNCYDVRFVPNSSNSEITGRNVELELEAIHTASGQTPEVFTTLSYIIEGEDVSISLNPNNSNVIRATSSTTTIPDINLTMTAHKKPGDTYSFEFLEFQNDTSSSRLRDIASETSNSALGFMADVYGENFVFGNWYFENTGTTTTDYGTNTGFQIDSRRLVYRPNTNDIKQQLNVDGSVRELRVTINLQRGSNTISSTTYTIVIYKADLPNFTISDATAIDEGGTAQFTITADRDPGSSPVTISYTPTNTTGNHLKTTDDSGTPQPSKQSGRSRSTPVTFSPAQGSTTEWTATLEVETVANDNDEPPRTITVVLDPVTGSIASAGYTAALAPDNSATVTINDLSKPEISIAPASAIVSTDNAEFTLTADVVPWQALAIKFTPNESGSSYLDTTDGASGVERTANPKIEFTATGSGTVATGTLVIPTIADTNATSGTISVQLVDDTSSTADSYDLANSNTSASVSITDRPTVQLSITGSSVSTNEGDAATIVISTETDPEVDDIKISYTPTETGSDFLDTTDGASGVSRTTTLRFTEDSSTGLSVWNAELTLNTKTANETLDNNGQIVVTLDSPGSNAFYTIPSSPNDRITVSVNDINDPTIKIDDDAPDIIMGEDAIFPVTASVLPNQDIKVRYSAVSTGGNFLERVGSQTNPIRTATVSFFAQGANQPIVGTLIVPTIVDPTNTPGSITITLVDDIDPNNYVISQTQSETEGMVNIQGLSVPTLSITSVSDNINEGEIAKFIVTASIQPQSPLDVEYTPTDVSGSYLDSTANPTGVEVMRTLTFEQRFGSSEWTAEINLRTRNEDRNRQFGGNISLKLSPSDDPTSFTIAGAPNDLAIVAIQDTDIPIISINDAPEILVGRTATFTLVSDIQPTQALNVTYIVRETEGNFLDETNLMSGEEQSKLFTFDTPSDQGFTTPLEIDTETDANSDSGTISVTIFDDFNNSPQLFTVSPNVANRSAEVSVFTTSSSNFILQRNVCRN